MGKSEVDLTSILNEVKSVEQQLEAGVTKKATGQKTRVSHSTSSSNDQIPESASNLQVVARRKGAPADKAADNDSASQVKAKMPAASPRKSAKKRTQIEPLYVVPLPSELSKATEHLNTMIPKELKDQLRDFSYNRQKEGLPHRYNHIVMEGLTLLFRRTGLLQPE